MVAKTGLLMDVSEIHMILHPFRVRADIFQDNVI
jgi:hypothetical protein